MRSVFLFGGFLGFAITAMSGLQAGRSGDRVLMDSAIACLIGAILFRWLWSRVGLALTETVKAKRAVRAAAEEAKAAAPAPVKAK